MNTNDLPSLDITVLDLAVLMIHQEQTNVAKGATNQIELQGVLCAGAYSVRVGNADRSSTVRLIVQ